MYDLSEAYRDIHADVVRGEVNHHWLHRNRGEGDAPREEEEQDQAANEEAQHHGQKHVQLPETHMLQCTKSSISRRVLSADRPFLKHIPEQTDARAVLTCVWVSASRRYMGSQQPTAPLGLQMQKKERTSLSNQQIDFWLLPLYKFSYLAYDCRKMSKKTIDWHRFLTDLWEFVQCLDMLGKCRRRRHRTEENAPEVFSFLPLWQAPGPLQACHCAPESPWRFVFSTFRPVIKP